MTTTTTTRTPTADEIRTHGKYLGRVIWKEPDWPEIRPGQWEPAPTIGTHDQYTYQGRLYVVEATDDVYPHTARAAALTYLARLEARR